MGWIYAVTRDENGWVQSIWCGSRPDKGIPSGSEQVSWFGHVRAHVEMIGLWKYLKQRFA